jgi:ATP-dependent DNA ligase
MAVRTQMGRFSMPSAARSRLRGYVLEVRSRFESLFPEAVAAALALREKNFILDGEIVIPVKGKFSFDDLLQRIHPAASRVKKLAEHTPALFLAFDLLKKGKAQIGDDLLAKRRLRLEDFATHHFSGGGLFRLSPARGYGTGSVGWSWQEAEATA